LRAIDTNVLARYYLDDDAAQVRAAKKILAAGEVFVPKTVILELEWVLRSVAEQPAAKVLDCLEHLVALAGVTIEDHEQIEVALEWCRDGIDFADALHLAASASCVELLTFDDRGYARKAARLGLEPPVRLPASE
jgi:predicted nucleic-acid-binding protein